MRVESGAAQREETQQVHLRLPVALHDTVTELAKRERRSLNSYVTLALERHVAAEKAAA